MENETSKKSKFGLAVFTSKGNAEKGREELGYRFVNEVPKPIRVYIT